MQFSLKTLIIIVYLCYMSLSLQISSKAFDICSNQGRIEALANVINCEPRPTLIDLIPPIHMMRIHPGHALVRRCVGSCWATPHKCTPVRSKNVSLAITGMTQYGREVCTTILVEEHTQCQCRCAVTPSDCTLEQYYSSSRCQCECEDILGKAECLVSGKEWSERSCSCSCPSRMWRPCSTGYIYDYRYTCACIRIQTLGGQENSCNSLLVVVVTLFVCLSIIVSAGVFFVKHRHSMKIKEICHECNKLNIYREVSRLSSDKSCGTSDRN